MTESTTPAQCSDADWKLARKCGLFTATPGTNTWDAALGRFADAIRAALAQQPQAAPVAQGLTDRQIAAQDARYAIDGAITYGRMGANKPPIGHWLTEYWSIGRQLARLGETSAWDNRTPVAAPRADQSEDARRMVAGVNQQVTTGAEPLPACRPGRWRDGDACEPAATSADRIQFSRCAQRGNWTTFNVRNEDADEVARRLLAAASASKEGQA